MASFSSFLSSFFFSLENFKCGSKILLRLREIRHPQTCRGWAGSSSSYSKASVNPPNIFLVLCNDHGAIQTIQPNFLMLPGLELGLPIPGPTGTPGSLSNLITFPVFSKLGSAPLWLLPCMFRSRNIPLCHFDFYCACQKVLLIGFNQGQAA